MFTQCLGSRPRLHHHYRGRRLSIWLNLLPQLQKTGHNTIYPSHNSLTLNHSDPFGSWGIIQNSSISSASNIIDSRSIGAAATACSTSGIKARNKDIDKVTYLNRKKTFFCYELNFFLTSTVESEMAKIILIHNYSRQNMAATKQLSCGKMHQNLYIHMHWLWPWVWEEYFVL